MASGSNVTSLVKKLCGNAYPYDLLQDLNSIKR